MTEEDLSAFIREDHPPMKAGDIYVFAHDTGAITIARHSDKTSRLVTMAQARQAVLATTQAEGRVWAAGHDAPLAVDTLNALDGPLITLTLFQPSGALPGGVDALEPLHRASFQRRDALVEDLVARGCDVHLRDVKGRTPLHFAAAAGSLRAINTLVHGGAEVAAADENGHTPRDHARSQSKWDAVELLLELERDQQAGGASTNNSGSVRFRGDAIFLLYFTAVFKLLYAAAIVFLLLPAAAAVAPLPLRLVGIALCAGLIALPPSWPTIWFGGPQLLTGSALRLHRPFRRSKVVDLSDSPFAAAGLTGLQHLGRYGMKTYRWMFFLTHPEGKEFSHKQLLRAGAATDVAERLLEVGERHIAIDFYGLSGLKSSKDLHATLTEIGTPLDLSVAIVLDRVESDLRRLTPGWRKTWERKKAARSGGSER